MKRELLSAIFILAFTGLFAQESNWAAGWSNSTAFNKTKGQWESGLMQPFRIGVTDKIEITSHLTMPILPEVGVKIIYGTKKGITFSGEHLVSYPSLFLDVVSREDIGGLISPEYEFGTIIALKNTFIASKPVWNDAMLTARAGLAFSFKSEKPDPQSTIDLPVFYPRMAHYYEGASIRPEVGIIKPIGKKLAVEEVARLFIITREENNFFAENSGTLMWAFSRTFTLKAGYILTYGSYPYGNQWQLWPTIDLVFGSKR